LAVTNVLDAKLRRITNGLTLSGGFLAWTTNAYDNASRLATVGNDTFTASYGYLANSALWGTLTFKQSGAARMTTTRQFDKLNRLLQVSAQPTGAPVSSAISYGYTYNDANRRTRATLTDGSYWVYQYDTLGQVISGKKYWSDGTPVAGQQFEYAFDDIGNRTSTKAGGDQAGANLRSATYTATTLNQYTNRTVPGAADVLGIAHPGATLSVNADSNVYRRGEYFRKELSINNASAAQYPLVSVVAGYQGTNTTDAGYLFVPQTPEVFVWPGTNSGTIFTCRERPAPCRMTSTARAPTA